MRLETHILSADFHPAVRRAIDEFRSYVCGRGNNASWPKAQALIQQVANEVNYAMGHVSHSPMADIVKMFRCELIVEEQPRPSRSASLDPKVGGFVIRLFRTRKQSQCPLFEACSGTGRPPADSLSPRDRFTVAHEVGHTLFYHWDGRTTKPQKLPIAQTSDRDEWRVEGLCHDFARALLIPQSPENLEQLSPSAASIATLAGEFHVTEEPVVRRMMYDWGYWPTTVVAMFRIMGVDSSVRIFRGRLRRRDRGLPSAHLLEELAKNTPSVEAIPQLLNNLLRANCDCLRTGHSTLWVIIPAR